MWLLQRQRDGGREGGRVRGRRKGGKEGERENVCVCANTLYIKVQLVLVYKEY